MQTSELIKYLKTVIEKGVASDDTRSSDRLIYHLLKIIRAEVIKQKTNQKQFISPQVYQTVCRELELVDKSELPDCYSTGELILRTKTPSILRSRSRPLIENVRSTAGGFIPYSLSNVSRYDQHSKHRSNAVQAILRNDYIYVITN